jgi:hypothetical protein
MYLDPSLLDEDEHSEYINATEDVSAYLGAIEREVRLIYNVNGIAVADIPVDGSDYLTADVAIAYTVAYAMYKIFHGYWGKRKGERDIYFDKMQSYWADVTRIQGMITQESLKGLEEDGEVKCKFATVRSVPNAG